MIAKQVVPGVYQISLGMVNVFLLEGDGLTLIDSGIPGSAPKILASIRELGKQPQDVRAILVTHLHADHTGSLTALREATGAEVYMHPLEAELFQRGQTMRPVQPAPGLVNKIVVSLLMNRAGPQSIEPGKVDSLLLDGDELAFAGGLQAIHVPGHTAGQMVFLWPKQGGVLFAGDACGNLTRLAYPFLFEDFELGKQSLRKLAGLEFENAVFSHGKPILGGASGKFREKWG